MFIEFQTYRFRAHSMFDPDLYRDPEEIEEWRQRGPIATFTTSLIEEGVVDNDDVEAMWDAAREETDRAVAAAEDGPLEPTATLTNHVVMERGSS